jgi:DNA-directed RNA polymerase specialized sigma24 family protein
MAKNYVNNKDLYEAMCKYHSSVKDYEKGLLNKKPQIPNYIGECIYLICTRLSYKPNFINYSYKEEMVGDGLENCIVAIDNFNPEKSANPFAYFTKIAYNAFIRRILKEKKQTYIKHKNFENLYSLDEIEGVFKDNHSSSQYSNDYSNEIILAFEEKNNVKINQKKLTKTNANLFEEENE